MSTHDDDRPERNPYDPLKRDLAPEAVGSGSATVQGLPHGHATRGMGYSPQTNSEAFGVHGRPPDFAPSRVAPASLSGSTASLGGTRRHYPRSDERIRDDIAERLYRSACLDVSEVSVDVKDGVVTLQGCVAQRRTKHDIENIAADTRGVKDVENRIRVSRAELRHSPGAENATQDRAQGASRGRMAPDLDVPEARPGALGHEEWLLDESIEESFPASDASSAVQPGSIAAEERPSQTK